MTDNNISEKYGNALFMLAEEEGKTERIRADIDIVYRVLAENPDYITLLDSPALSREVRCGIIDESLGSMEKELVSLIKILAEKRLIYRLKRVLDEFGKAYDASRGIERVDVISAVPLTDAQKERLGGKLEAMTGKHIIVRNYHDPALLGGIKLRMGGMQLDSSLRTKLDEFEKKLSELVI